MTRKLIALLALLSGLAALSGPAVASHLAPTSSCDAKISAVSDRGASDEELEEKRQAKTLVKSAKGRERRYRAPAPKRLQAPLLMGVERAHE